MTKIKLCGLSRSCDIIAANELSCEYVGFVFAKKSRRYISFEKAYELKKLLSKEIQAVGVFTGEDPLVVAGLLKDGIIDIAQLHADEDEAYIERLKSLTDKQIIKAFCIENERDMEAVKKSSADHVLLDSGKGSGEVFEWSFIKDLNRPYFLAGGLSALNVGKAVELLHPFAVDVSSNIETGGLKDKNKMAAFVAAVRKEKDR